MSSSENVSTPGRFGKSNLLEGYVKGNILIEDQQGVLRDVTQICFLDEKGSSDDWNEGLSSIPEDLPHTNVTPVARNHSRLISIPKFPGFTTRQCSHLSFRDSRLGLRKPAEEIGWSFIFSPGFNDIVNDTIRFGRNACIVANSFSESEKERSTFLRYILEARNGTNIPDLLRKIDHLYYMRVEFSDVLMFHPNAWGFPEADLSRTVMGVPGKERDPVHGWLWQPATSADREMVDVEFSYDVVERRIPSTLIENVRTGKLPMWLTEVSHIHADMSGIEKVIPNATYNWEARHFLEAGLVDERDVYMKFDEIKNARTIEPDRLGSSIIHFKVKGLDGLRLALGAYAEQTPNPMQVRSMAFQLGIAQSYHFYWFSLMALHYPLPNEWSLGIRDGMRFYVHLPSGRAQSIHPMLSEFKQMLNDLRSSESLWDIRGTVAVRCDECGAPDSILFCQNCTDNYCFGCFISVHRHRKSHAVIPVAGCRYLTASEVDTLGPILHLTNNGFCNRRRLLARTNQSDKTGACQCEWIHFDSEDALDYALVHSSAVSLTLNNPPRLVPGRGFFYNFRTSEITDDDSFVSKTKEQQKAVLCIQRWVRGALSRIRLLRMHSACIVIQKNLRMLFARSRFGRKSNGRCNPLIVWYTKFKLRRSREITFTGVVKLQALCRRHIAVRKYLELLTAVVRMQALFRGVLTRRRLAERIACAIRIQSFWRGVTYGFRYLGKLHAAASRIQARVRGWLVRDHHRELVCSCRDIQAIMRGFLARKKLDVLTTSAILVQTWWRRFVAIRFVKKLLLSTLRDAVSDYDELIREKSKNLAATEIQKSFRKHLARRLIVQMKRTKINLTESVAHVASLFGLALMGIDRTIHPWFQYLPETMRERMSALRGVIQRGIVYSGHEVTREVVVAIIKEIGARTDLLLWTRHCLGHLFSRVLNSETGVLYENRNREEKLVSVVDSLLRFSRSNHLIDFTLQADTSIQETLMTAEVLITYRQFLDQSMLRLDSQLSFQGVDSVAAADVIKIFENDIGTAFPSSWANGVGKSTCSKVRDRIIAQIASLKGTQLPLVDRNKDRSIFFVSRHDVLNACKLIGRHLQIPSKSRFSKHGQEISSLLHIGRSSPDSGTHEHSQFLVAVILVHMVIRSVLIRKKSEQAALTIQVFFRYFKARTLSKRLLGPTLVIQRVWRGLSTGLVWYRKNEAAIRIQSNFRLVQARRRNKDFRNKVESIQKVWRGAIQRKWLHKVKIKTNKIQSVFRAHLVRLTLNKEGRRILQSFRAASFKNDELKQRILSLEYQNEKLSLKNRVLAAKKSRARIAQAKIDQFRIATRKLNLFPPEKISRLSFCEPKCFASRRIRLAKREPKSFQTSSQFVLKCKAIFPMSPSLTEDRSKLHAIARRGAAAIASKSMGTFSHDPLTNLSRTSGDNAWLLLEKRFPYLPVCVKNSFTQPRFSTMALLNISCLNYGFLCRDFGNSGRPGFTLCVPVMHYSIKQLLQASDVGEAAHELRNVILEKVSKQSGLGTMINSCCELVRLLLMLILSNSDIEQESIPVYLLWISEIAQQQYDQLAMDLCRAIDDQFTPKVSLYRSIQLSRPEWSVLNRVAANALHVSSPPSDPNEIDDSIIKKASEFKDFVSELLMAWCSRSTMEQIHLFIEKRVIGQKYETIWSDDVEVRSIVAVFQRLAAAIMSRSSNVAIHLNAVLGSVLTGLWTGVSLNPFFQEALDRCIDQPYEEKDITIVNPLNSGDETKNIMQILSLPMKQGYGEYIDAIPRRKAKNNAVKVQSLWRGFHVRKHFRKISDICRYIKDKKWPPKAKVLPPPKSDIPRVMSMVSPKSVSVSIPRPTTPIGVHTAVPKELSNPIQADHIACAKLIFILCYLLYSKTRMELVFSRFISLYSRIAAVFADLLSREDRYHEVMIDTSAELVRMTNSMKRVKTAPSKQEDKPPQQDSISKLGRRIRDEFLSRKLVIKTDSGQPASLKEASVAQISDGEAIPKQEGYMNEYLRLNDGDDSMFRDISPDVQLGQQTTDQTNSSLEPIWLPVRASKYGVATSRIVAKLSNERLRRSFIDHQKRGEFIKCFSLISDLFEKGSESPFRVENAYHLMVGFVAASVKDGRGETMGLQLMNFMVGSFDTGLRSCSQEHRDVIEAMVFDTGIGLAYACPEACRNLAESWFTGASQRYLSMNQVVRYSKVLTRYGCVLRKLGSIPQSVFFTSQAIDKLEEVNQSSTNLCLIVKANRAVLNAINKELEVAEVEIRQVARAATKCGEIITKRVNELKEIIMTLRSTFN